MARSQATHVTGFHSNRQSDVHGARWGTLHNSPLVGKYSLRPLKRGPVFGFRAQCFEGRLALDREKILTLTSVVTLTRKENPFGFEQF